MSGNNSLLIGAKVFNLHIGERGTKHTTANCLHEIRVSLTNPYHSHLNMDQFYLYNYTWSSHTGLY